MSFTVVSATHLLYVGDGWAEATAGWSEEFNEQTWTFRSPDDLIRWLLA